MRDLHPNLLNLPNVSCLIFVRFRFLTTLLCRFVAFQAYSYRIFSPLNIRDSPLLLLRLFGFSFLSCKLRRTVWGTPRIRLDLLLGAVVVPIALTGVVRCSDIIFIEFVIYLRSMSSPFRSRALQCFLYFYTINTLKIVKSQTPLNALSTPVSRTKTDRNRNTSSSTTS